MSLTSARKSINLRSIALPAEHGGWSMILEPLILGLLLVFSWSGLIFALAMFLAFLTHQPAKIFIKDSLKNRYTKRTQFSLFFLLGYGLTALFFALPIFLNAPMMLWWVMLMILPFVVIQLAYDFQNKSRDLVPELFGAIALSGTVSLIALIGDLTLQVALCLWLLIGLRAIVSIFFVRALFRKQRDQAVNIPFMYGIHLIAIVVVSSLAFLNLTPYLAIVPFIILLVRARQSINSPSPLKAKTVGIREIIYGVVTILCIGLGFSLGW